jgi:hypothetical protein
MTLTTTTPNHRTERRHLTARLDREWEQLCRRPAVLARARAWHVTATPFRSLGELLRLAGYRVAPSPEADELLRRLVRVAADDPLAARVVLQRILPGLLVIVRREQLRDPGVDALDLLAAEAWLAIVTYRADVRRTDVAAKLLNDARHRAFTNPRRRQEHTREEIVAPATLDLPRLPQPSSSFEELTILLREARRDGLADADLAVVRDYLSDASADELAAAGEVTVRTLRNRRRRSIERIRQLAA